jgi:hypothetical protein
MLSLSPPSSKSRFLSSRKISDNAYDYFTRKDGNAMNEMNRKKLYVWRLATFLHSAGTKMSGEELAAHLNRNGLQTSYGTEFEGGRGTFKLIKVTYDWVNDELGLEDEARKVAEAFVKPDGTHAWSD